MPLYENSNCPVCQKPFENGDDVVFCPDCGTPHHRECYRSLGHCANEELHRSGFNYYEANKNTTAPAETAEEKKTPAGSFPLPPFPPRQENTEQKSGEENQNQPMPFGPFGATPNFSSQYEADRDTIDGESVSDYAAVVRSNIPRFLGIFKKMEKTNKQTSWNWGAFFFGSMYFFFRRMYRQGTYLLVLFAAIMFGTNTACLNLAPDSYAAMTNVYNLIYQNKMEAAMESYSAMQSITDIKYFSIIGYVSFGIFIIIRVLEALYADKAYKTHISSIIKKVSEQLNDGAMFTSMMIFPDQEVNLSPEQMKKLYLARRGGVSIFAPLIAYMAFRFVIMLLNYL